MFVIKGFKCKSKCDFILIKFPSREYKNKYLHTRTKHKKKIFLFRGWMDEWILGAKNVDCCAVFYLLERRSFPYAFPIGLWYSHLKERKAVKQLLFVGGCCRRKEDGQKAFVEVGGGG